MTAAGAIVGTPAYMAPEQATGGAIGPWTDVYGLGATLYHARFGEPPIVGDSFAVIAMQLASPYEVTVRAHSAATSPLDDIIFRALRKKPSERYASASEMVAALERARLVSQRALQRRATVPAAPLDARPLASPAPKRTFLETARTPPRAIAAMLVGSSIVGAGSIVLLAKYVRIEDDAAAPPATATVTKATAPPPRIAAPGEDEPQSIDAGARVVEVQFGASFASNAPTCARLDSGELWCWRIADDELRPFRMPRGTREGGVQSFVNAAWVFAQSAPYMAWTWNTNDLTTNGAPARAFVKDAPLVAPWNHPDHIACASPSGCFVIEGDKIYASDALASAFVRLPLPKTASAGARVGNACNAIPDSDAVVHVGERVYAAWLWHDGAVSSAPLRIAWRPIANVEGVEALTCDDTLSNMFGYTTKRGPNHLIANSPKDEPRPDHRSHPPSQPWLDEAPLALGESSPGAWRTWASECHVQRGAVVCKPPSDRRAGALVAQATPIEGYALTNVWTSPKSMFTRNLAQKAPFWHLTAHVT